MSCHQYCKFWENRKFFLVVWFPTDGKKALVTVPFPVFVYCCCRILSPFSFTRVISTSLGILSYTTGPSSTAASFASLSTNSFPFIPGEWSHISCESFNLCSASFTVWPHATCSMLRHFSSMFDVDPHIHCVPVSCTRIFGHSKGVFWPSPIDLEGFQLQVGNLPPQLTNLLPRYYHVLLITYFRISSSCFPTGTVGVAHIF